MLALGQPGALQGRAGLAGDGEQEGELLLALFLVHRRLEAEHDRTAREAHERQRGARVLAGLLGARHERGQLGGHLLARPHQHHLAGAGAHHRHRAVHRDLRRERAGVGPEHGVQVEALAVGVAQVERAGAGARHLADDLQHAPARVRHAVEVEQGAADHLQLAGALGGELRPAALLQLCLVRVGAGERLRGVRGDARQQGVGAALLRVRLADVDGQHAEQPAGDAQVDAVPALWAGPGDQRRDVLGRADHGPLAADHARCVLADRREDLGAAERCGHALRERREARGGVALRPQLQGRGLLLGHVGEHVHRCHHDAVLVADRGGAHLPPAVAEGEHRGRRRGRSAQRRRRARLVLQRDQVRDVVAGGVDAAACEPGEGGVCAQHDAVHADEDDRVVERVEGCLPLGGHDARRALGPAGAQHGAHRRDQHGILGGREVRICAGVEAHRTAARVARGGGEVDDGRVGGARGGAQSTRDLDAVDVRQRHVEQHGVGALAAGVLQAVGSGRGLQHQQAVELQGAPVGVPLLLVHADDQDALERRRGAHGRAPCAAVGWRRPHTPRDDTGPRACLPSGLGG